MFEAFAVGSLAQSSLLLSGLVVYWFTMPKRVVGWLAGFGSGALLGAAAFELIPETPPLSSVEVACWMLAGGVVYVIADRLIEARFDDSDGGGGVMGIIVGNVNDALPESLIFGIQLGAGLVVSVSFVAAIWISNIPQALPASAELARSGWDRRKMAIVWGSVVVLAGVFAAVGFGVTDVLSTANGARVASFTVGGLITMLTTSMIPFAYEQGGAASGLWASAAFALALATS